MRYLFLIPFLHFYFSAATQSLSKTQISAIEQSIKEEMKYSSTPGIAVCIINNGKVVYQKSFGVANTTTSIPVTDTTIFEIASLTKMFTSVALQSALQKQGIGINEPISKVINGLSPGLASITFAQLLSHTSGVMDSWPLRSDCADNVVDYFVEAGDKGLFETPGKVFSYSNNGFALAGLALANLNKTSYPKAIEDYILKPLQMANSSFNIFDVVYHSFAVGHNIDNNGKASPTLLSFYKKSQPAGGLFSNIRDLSNFALALVNRGTLNNTQLIGTKIIDTLFGARNTAFSVPAGTLNYLTYADGAYGYGTINFRYNNLNFIGHPGEGVSQNAFLFMEPDKKFAVIMLSNRGFYLFMNSFKKITDVVLGVKEGQPVPFKTGNKNFQQFIGKYAVPDISKSGKQWSEIFEKEGKLFMKMEDGRTFELTQMGTAEFSFTDKAFLFPSAIAFYKDEQGKYQYLNYLFRTRNKVE
jgi:CubicO group peptidase (beta-lactamase class C family)